MDRRIFGAVGVMTVLAVAGFGEFIDLVPFEFVPLDRLIQNTTAYISEHPADPMGPYTLARIHYLALVTRSASLIVDKNYPDGALPEGLSDTVVDQNGKPLRELSPPKTKQGTEQSRYHLDEAVLNYQKSIAMDARNPLFHLGLASVAREALKADFKPDSIPGDAAGTPDAKNEGSRAHWREYAIAEFRKSYELSIESKTGGRAAEPVDSLTALVRYEAAQRYVEMVQSRGVRDAERTTVKTIQSSLESLQKSAQARLYSGPITPIIFRLHGKASLGDLLDSQRTVTFDLDGTGREQRYTWLGPDTEILVWDPANAGRIASGHQLFGSVSFRMFWSDGYRALDALDDNRDGELRGKELRGLAVWMDRNQNGVSDAGEVIPIEQTAIAGISIRATACIGESLSNEAGLTMTDGRVLPTYDWLTRSLKPALSSADVIPSSQR
ncbi:MAG TPA: hypothetical protein VFY29_19445 [Terriglobia bacterium]|nr:hypothetical protein [Terriglobia bacterium]